MFKTINGKIKKICNECGRSYLTFLVNQKYCSRTCMGEHQHKLPKKHTTETRVCVYCKKQIRVTQVNPKHPRLFCSMRCRSRFQKENIEKELQKLGGTNLIWSDEK